MTYTPRIFQKYIWEESEQNFVLHSQTANTVSEDVQLTWEGWTTIGPAPLPKPLSAAQEAAIAALVAEKVPMDGGWVLLQSSDMSNGWASSFLGADAGPWVRRQGDRVFLEGMLSPTGATAGLFLNPPLGYKADALHTAMPLLAGFMSNPGDTDSSAHFNVVCDSSGISAPAYAEIKALPYISVKADWFTTDEFPSVIV